MNPLVQLHRGMFAEWCEYSHLFMPWPKRCIKGVGCVDLDLKFLQRYGEPPIEGDILYVPFLSLS